MGALTSLTLIAVLVTPSLGHAIPLISKRDSRLKVELSQAHATEVNAVMTNTGSEPLKLLDYGTLMDKNPVQKLNVFRDGKCSYLSFHFRTLMLVDRSRSGVHRYRCPVQDV
jgi:Deuterolysin metalloprotease (M35) family